APHGLRVRLENDVDLRRAHSLCHLRRIVARHRLQKDALREAHALLFGELLGGHDLAPRDPCHVGDDRLDLIDAVIAKELLNVTRHASPARITSFVRARDSRPRTPRRVPARTYCSSPSTRGATAPRSRSGSRFSPGTLPQVHPGHEPRR